MSDNKKEFFPNTTQKPNFIFDVIMRKCGKENPHAYLVLDAMVRKIYGWWKEVDAISNSQLIEMTGLSEQTVRRSVRYLLKNKIIGRTQKGNGRKISRYKITIYEYAKINQIEVPTRNPSEGEVPNGQVRGAEQEPYKVPNGNPQKKENKITKEIIKEKIELSEQPKEPFTQLSIGKFTHYKERLKSINDKFGLTYYESSKSNQLLDKAIKNFDGNFIEYFDNVLKKLERLTTKKLNPYLFKRSFTIDSLLQFNCQDCSKVESLYNEEFGVNKPSNVVQLPKKSVEPEKLSDKETEKLQMEFLQKLEGMKA